MVFAVGDRVDEDADSPTRTGSTSRCPATTAAATRCRSAAGARSQDLRGRLGPARQRGGWPRRLARGQIARRDLSRGPAGAAAAAEQGVEALRRTLVERGATVVDYPAVQRLEAAEKARAAADKVEEFKFRSDREMLDAIRT